MKRFLAISRFMVARTLEYRTETFFWVFISVMPTLVLILTWQAVYQGATQLNGLSLQQTVQYYLWVGLIAAIIETHFESFRSTEIRNGKIDFYLMRPLPYILEVFWKDIIGKGLFVLFFSPVFLLLVWLFVPQLSLSMPSAAAIFQTGSFLALIMASYVINFMIAFMIVLGTFWLEGSQGLEHFKWIMTTLFSGSLIPLAFMPGWLQQLVNWLPLKFLYAIPIGVIQGTYQLSLADLLYLVVTILCFSFCTNWLYQQSIMKYTSAGG